MGTSVSVGVAALAAAGADAVLMVVCDQPRLTVDALQRLMAANPGHGIVVARYGGTVGVPAIFSAAYFPKLRELAGDVGARSLIRQHEADVVAVDLPEAADDFNSAADWERFSVE